MSLVDLVLLILVALLGLGLVVIGVLVDNELRRRDQAGRTAAMKVKTYQVLARAVEEGMQSGITRVFKYAEADRIHETELREQAHLLSDAVLAEISEWMTFEDEHES